MRDGFRGFLLLCLLSACSARQAPEPHTVQADKAAAPGFGGRLFDSWSKELRTDFVPDDPKTPELDGRGGPFGNGTLADASGAAMANPGHDYRFKKLFGSDLRGKDGIDGAAYADKAHVLVPDLLQNHDAREQWVARLEHGEDAIPAYGSVLSRAQIEAVVDFLLAVRDGKLPQPADVLSLSAGTPGFYVLAEGGDAQRGHALFGETCAGCHGADGTALAIDDGEFSLGTIARLEGASTWLKVLSGQPGSSMHAQLPLERPRSELAQSLRDLGAALCDRTRYPQGQSSTPDAADGDPRCGSYLR
jgi:mono/diheme cytochrome c family protein